MAYNPFPEEAGRFAITSTPIFLLIRGDQTELLMCKATMMIDTAEPYVTQYGSRRVDVRVQDWVATGTSKLLGGEVQFRLMKERPLKSWVTGGKMFDFPAELHFGMRYEVETPAGTLTDLTGLAKGAISDFPPRTGDVFFIQKELQIGDLRVVPVACACAAEGVLVSLPG